MFAPFVLLFCGVLAWETLPWPALAGATAEVQVTAEVKHPLPEGSVGKSPAAEPAANPSAAGHWETRRVGLFRTRQVWVADPPKAAVPFKAADQATLDRTDTAPAPAPSSGAGCPPGGT